MRSIGAPPLLPHTIAPMLASMAAAPFDASDFWFEVKWDGFRCLAFLESSTRLQSRRGHDLTGAYPELSELHLAVRGQPAVLDGEIVLLASGKPDFAALLARQRLSDPARRRALSEARPVTYVAFDLLYWKGQSITACPLHRRRSLLREIVRPSGNLVVTRHVEQHGIAYAEAVFAQGLEGVMAKRMDSPYLPGRRTRHWLKIKRPKVLRAVLIGYTARAGGGVGSVLLGLYGPSGLVPVGAAAVHLPQPATRELDRLLHSLRCSLPPVPSSLPSGRRLVHWVEPRLVGQVSYLEQTPQGNLRHAQLQGLVGQKPEECTLAQLGPAKVKEEG